MTAELDDVPFSVVRRGYDRNQVEDRLNRLGAELDAAVAGRNAAVDDVRSLTRQRDASRSETQAARTANAEARAELDRLRAQVAELSVIPHTVDGMSERLQQMVRIAQDEVNDMRSRATTGATQILTMAQAEADELRERSDAERREFEAERRSAEESLRSQLEESQTRLDQLRHDSDGQMARLDAELADRRGRAEQGLGAELEERRAAMHGELATVEARHREDAARILESANQDARNRLAEATNEAQRVRAESRSDVAGAHRELEELRGLQHQISEQLTSVRALLDWTLPQIASGQRSTDHDRSRIPVAEAPVFVPQQSPAQPSAPAQPSSAAQSQSQPAQSQPAQSQPAQSQPAQSQPAQSQPAQSQPAQSQPVRSAVSERTAVDRDDDGPAGSADPDRGAQGRVPDGPDPRGGTAPAAESTVSGPITGDAAPERPTPIARHSRMSAPSGRR